jgi:putative membrane protein
MTVPANRKYAALATALALAWSVSATAQAPGSSGAQGDRPPATSQDSGQKGGAMKKDSATSAKSDKDSKVSRADRKWMENAAQANLAEIETGKLASSKGTSDDVKKYGDQMVKDHTAALEELQQIAKNKGVTLPTEPDRAHQRALKNMDKAAGEDFDRQYMSRAGVDDHQKTHRLFESQAKSGKDAELKAYAEKTLPVIDRHLEMARQSPIAKASSKGSSKGGSQSAGTAAPAPGTSSTR